MLMFMICYKYLMSKYKSILGCVYRIIVWNTIKNKVTKPANMVNIILIIGTSTRYSHKYYTLVHTCTR